MTFRWNTLPFSEFTTEPAESEGKLDGFLLGLLFVPENGDDVPSKRRVTFNSLLRYTPEYRTDYLVRFALFQSLHPTVVQVYTPGPCTRTTVCSRTASPRNQWWTDLSRLSRRTSGARQHAGPSVKQCSLFEVRGRQFRPSSTDKVEATLASHLLTDIGGIRANVSTQKLRWNPYIFLVFSYSCE